MKSIGLIAGVFIAMILAAVVTRKCGYVYTDTHPTAESQRFAVEHGDTVMSGYNKKTGEATVADTTRATYYACGSRVNGSDWPVGVVGLLVLVIGLWRVNKVDKVKASTANSSAYSTSATSSKWKCKFDGTLNDPAERTCLQCGRSRSIAESV